MTRVCAFKISSFKYKAEFLIHRDKLFLFFPLSGRSSGVKVHPGAWWVKEGSRAVFQTFLECLSVCVRDTSPPLSGLWDFCGLHYAFPPNKHVSCCIMFVVLKGCSNLATLVHVSARHLKRNVKFERHERRQKVVHLEDDLFNVFSN